MKWILLILIKLYWKYFPVQKRKVCLFKETCSHYVYRHTEEHGFWIGLKALVQRLKQCRNGYNIYTGENGFEMELIDGTIVQENEISIELLKPFYESINRYSNDF